jgi:hypothetical protein
MMRLMLFHDLHEDVLSEILTYCDVYAVVSFLVVISYTCALAFIRLP